MPMTSRETATYLGISYDKLMDMVRAHLIPHYRLGPLQGRVYFHKEILDDWILAMEMQNCDYKDFRKKGLSNPIRK
jgi:excisionase family DNA binding protein